MAVPVCFKSQHCFVKGHPETFIFKGWHKSNAAQGRQTLAGWVCRCVPAAFNIFVCGVGSRTCQCPSLGQGITHPRGLHSGVGYLPGSNPSYHVQHREVQPLVKPAMPRLIRLDMGVLKICMFQVRKKNRHSTHSSV